jgi:hypothetical protein
LVEAGGVCGVLWAEHGNQEATRSVQCGYDWLPPHPTLHSHPQSPTHTWEGHEVFLDEAGQDEARRLNKADEAHGRDASACNQPTEGVRGAAAQFQCVGRGEHGCRSAHARTHARTHAHTHTRTHTHTHASIYTTHLSNSPCPPSPPSSSPPAAAPAGTGQPRQGVIHSGACCWPGVCRGKRHQPCVETPFPTSLLACLRHVGGRARLAGALQADHRALPRRQRLLAQRDDGVDLRVGRRWWSARRALVRGCENRVLQPAETETKPDARATHHHAGHHTHTYNHTLAAVHSWRKNRREAA